MPHTYIFDLDGVIADTAKYHFRAWKTIAADLGIELTDRENEKLKGVGRRHSLTLILEMGNKSLAPNDFEEVLHKKNQIYLDFTEGMGSTDALPGAHKILEHLKNREKKIVLGSASRNAHLVLEKIGLKEYFDIIVDGNRVTTAKPDPEIFLRCAHLSESRPGNCIVFEDAVAGINAAKTAGMTAVGIGNPDVLTEADHVFPHLGEIPFEFLEKL